MSKIVCEVCGTSYPDTTTQCPICGNVKSDASAAAFGGATGAEGYTYIKGGRFSHANVKKRNNGNTELPREAAPAKPVQQQSAPAPASQQPAAAEREDAPLIAPRRRPPQQQKKDGLQSNVALLIVVIVLVVAILAVCAFLVVKLINMSDPSEGPSTTTSQTQPSTSSTVKPTDPVPCTGIRVSMPSYRFTQVGQMLLLNATPEPENTTEPIIFTSSDPYIASVDTNGKITAVANGSVIITVTCGEFSTTCEITCNVGVEPSYPSVPPVTGPTDPKPTTSTKPTIPFVKLELNRSDFTLEGHGSTHNLYDGQLDPASITWSSSNEEVATVVNGIVTAVGNGQATITAVYQDQKATCVVRCTKASQGGFTLSTYDTTIKVGGTFVLKAYDSNGERIDPSELKFSTAEEGFISVSETGVVKGLKNNWSYKTKYKIVYVEYMGEVQECIVRVKD